MKQDKKDEIEKISKEFAGEFKDSIGEIAGSGWLIVDPLSGYLNFIGHKNVLQQIPATENNPQILIMTFPDGTQLIPSGSNLPIEGSKDWMWIDKTNDFFS